MSAGNILAIDASAEACSVALCVEGSRYQLSSDVPRTHAQTLLPMIDRLLSEAQTSLESLENIAVVHGPGSFTGIRIAISVAQGLSYSSGVSVLCLSSLQVMASTLKTDDNVLIVPALDARMGEVYWASYSAAEGQMLEVEPARASSISGFSSALARLSAHQTVIGAGNAFSLDEIGIPDGVKTHVWCQPDASKLLDALTYFSAESYDAADLQPLYVRNEVAWEKRRRIRQVQNTLN